MAAGIGWAAKRNRDGLTIPGCWVTQNGYTVAEMHVDDLVAYAITPPGSSVPVAYRTDREAVVAVIVQHMAGEAVAKFAGAQ